MKSNKIDNDHGFTIIELMIAIAILSIILILCTVVLIGISNYYTKGVNISNVQNDNRNIVNQLTSDIKFSGTSMVVPNNNPVSYGSTKVYAFCFGDIRYSYVLGFSSGALHTLWRDQMPGEGSCYPLNLTKASPSCYGAPSSGCLSGSNGSDLLPTDMHLADFSVSPATTDGNLYSITVAIALGSTSSYFVPSTAPGPGQGLEISNYNFVCKSTIGQQFCATSTLTAMADRRLGSVATSAIPLSGTLAQFGSPPHNPYYCSGIKQQAARAEQQAEAQAYSKYNLQVSYINNYYYFTPSFLYQWYSRIIQSQEAQVSQQYQQSITLAQSQYNKTLASQGCS